MGYTTEFEGKIYIDEPVSLEDIEYINNFCNTRRMKRDVNLIKARFPDWAFMCYKGKLGTEGEYFVNPPFMGQLRDGTIEDYNEPPATQPGLWCSWEIVPEEDVEGKTQIPVSVQWSGTEKFYYYTEWLEYIFANFFPRPQYNPYGVIFAQGEDSYDAHYIIVENGIIRMISYDIPLDEMLASLTDERVKQELKDIYKDPADVEDNSWDDDDDW